MKKETLIQYFEWYLPEDGRHWTRLANDAPHLKTLGITGAWLPPAYKGIEGIHDVGYGVYDMYDLGEFDQKGSVCTKYGTKDEFLHAIDALHQNGLQAYLDVVFNHRMGADATEKVMCRDVDPTDRTNVISQPREMEVWTKFDFPGRKDQYSDFKWDWTCFNGTDYTKPDGSRGILLFEGKNWSTHVSQAQGNFDYIMGDDADFSNPRVLEELYKWGQWFQRLTHADGYRIDAVKSIDATFFNRWIHEMSRMIGTDQAFAVGEYWSGDVRKLKEYLDDCSDAMLLFDVPLHFNLQKFSNAQGKADLRKVFDNTLFANNPDRSVLFVDNHDTQPGQALQSWVLDWFKPQAYTLILLRDAKYPMIFYGDLYGIPHDNIQPVPHLSEMIWIRSHLLGEEVTEIQSDDPQKLCWSVDSSEGHHPVFVLMTIGDRKSQTVQRDDLAGKSLINIMDLDHPVLFDENGQAVLSCAPGGMSVFMLPEDYDRMRKDLLSEEQ